MFKSVFAKYISAFMSIILLSFVMIIVIIAFIIGSYSEETKADMMENAARSSATYLEDKLASEEGSGLEPVLQNHAEDVQAMLSVIVANSEDITILLSDNEGRILSAVGSDADEVAPDASIPKTLMDEVNNGTEISQSSQLYTIFEHPHYIYAVPVYDEMNLTCGTVFICSSSMMRTELLEVIIKTIVIASLWVLMAALIAVYFISEKVIGPLKEISKAAKSFAAGKFDVRVSVKGRDEVAELAVAFNNMAESLNNYDNMRNSFMSNVSHDLRSPMTSIAGFIDGILDGVIPPEKHRYYLQIVSNEVKRLSRLVASLLDLSRIQAGERKFVMKPFDICEMARQIIISCEQRLLEKKLQVEFLCDEDNMTVVADHDAIYQILYNLCDNAIKFSKEGGQYRITIAERTDIKNKIQVSVYNSGQGIAVDDIPFVFERFYKGDKSRGLDKKGAGLGLYIAKTIITAHHEEIWVTSEYGKDCQFSFTLTKGAPQPLRKSEES